ncbi:MAG TPA: hypothetical protein VNR90_17000 [Vicinamibacterales bacterium]|nr:hypothetical protein [Vicinamibacterales bacterium]
MARPWVRLVLVFAGLASLAGAGFVVWSSEDHARAGEASWRIAGDAGRRVLADAAELRSAQQAYVAIGQGEDFWFARVGALSSDLDEVLSVFKSHLSSPEAVASAGEAIAATQDFQQVDKRAREYTRAGQQAQASDVIFGDGFDVAQKLSTAVAQALSSEGVARDAGEAARHRREIIALAGGAGAAAFMMLLLIPGARPPAAADAPPAVLPVSKGTLDDLHDFDMVVSRAPRKSDGVDLAGIASVCSDLARVTDTSSIPALLERAAGILDAAGIVLWIADPDGRELSPIVVHGYSPQIATRLGTIVRDATNVTALAYRTGLLQTVKGDKVSNGAVAAPLLTAGGCLGVMAAEMKNGGEQREPLLAAATIIASQLSTLVGPPSARARAEAAG